MSSKQFSIELPAYWVSALVNGDYSCLDTDTLEECIAWCRDNPNACIISCNDISYIGHCNGLMCDMFTYEGYYTL